MIVNFANRVRIRARVVLSAGFAALLLLPALAAAQQQQVSLLVDSDANRGTGCTVSVAGQSLPGVDLRIDARIALAASPSIDAVTQASCVGQAFGAETTSSATAAFGQGNGTGNGDVVEFSLAGAALGSSTQRVALGASTSGARGDDALFTADGTGGGAPIQIFGITVPPIAIPGPGGIALLALGLVVLVVGVHAVRRRRHLLALSLFGLVLVTGVAMAAGFIADGEIGDWTGRAPVATGAADDDGVALRALYVAHEGEAFVRVDVDGLAGTAPVFTSADSAIVTVGQGADVAIVASGDPAPMIALTGALPSGISFDPATARLTGTAAAGTGGSYALGFEASNSYGSASQTFTLLVHELPTITSAAGTTFQAGLAGSFAVTADGFPAPTFTATGTLPAGVSFASTGELAGTPAAGSGGTYTLSITATNAVGTSAAQVFTLSIDDSPVFTSAASTTFAVGTAGTFTVAASGTPAPTLALTGGTLPNGVTFDPATGALAGTPAAGTGGVAALVFTASNAQGSATQSFTLTVNEQPTITSAASTTFQVDQSGSFAVTADGFPAPTFAATGTLPAGIALAPSGQLAGTPAAGSGGTYTLAITASNAAGTSVAQVFTLSISDGPAFTSAASTTFTVGAPGTFTVASAGAPAPTLALTGGTLPSGVAFDPATGVLAGTPAAGTGGVAALEFTASNTDGVASQPFTLTVNELPTITSATSATFQVGQAGSFSVTADGFPTPTFTAAGTLPAGVTLAASGQLAGTPAAGSGGTYTLSITATNAAGASAAQVFTLSINDGPVFTSASSTTLAVGSAGTFTVAASGSPTPTLALTTGTLPSGVTFNPATGALAGTPAAGTGGVFALVFTASNAEGNSTQSFTLTVNEQPTITSAASATFPVGQAGSFSVTADGFPAPTFAATGTLPAGVTFSPAGTLAGTPAAGSGGTYTLAITASNVAGTSTAQAFTLTINDGPAFTSATATTFTVDSAGTFTIAAIGTPAPTLALTGGALPNGVSFVAASGTLSGTPADGTGGTYALTFTATNSEGSATQAFTLTVNEQPAITSAATAAFPVGQAGSFVVTADGFPAATFEATGALPAGVTFAASGELAGTPAAGTGGTYLLSITATNAAGSSTAQAFTLAVNDGPVFTSTTATTFTVDSAGAFTVTASGTPAPTLALTAGTLPVGITFNPSTGALAGTPADGTGGTYALTFTATNSQGNTTQAFMLTVNEQPAITSAATTTFQVGQAGSFTVTADGFPAATFAATGALPAGVTFAASGELAGTPAAGTGGTYPLTITATNSVGTSTAQSFTLSVTDVPAFTSAASATFTVGSAGAFTVTASGTPTPTLALTGGILPAGVTFTPSTGALVGTPAAASGGVVVLQFTASNSEGDTTQAFTLTVNERPALTNAGAATFTVGQAGSFAFVANGYPAATTFALAGTLPAGVTFDTATGVLSGTPATGTGGTRALTATATNTAGTSDAQAFTLTVNEAPAFTSATAFTFTVGQPQAVTIAATGTPAPTLALSGGSLPAGLAFNGASGQLSGSPQANTGGQYSLAFTATNSAGSATSNVVLTVRQPPAITSPSSLTVPQNQPFSFQVTASGYPAPASVSISGDALPSGVTFNPSTGVLQGTPTGVGTYALSFGVATVAGSATQAFAFSVVNPLQVTSAASHDCVINQPCTFQFTANGAPAPTITITGNLPNGVTFDAGTGALSGTPAATTPTPPDLPVLPQGTYAIEVRASNGVHPDGVQQFTLRVGPLITAISPAALVPGTAATITGIGFKPVATENMVTINGVTAQITGGGPGTLDIVVPCAVSGVRPVRVTGVGDNQSPLFPHPVQPVQALDLAPGESAVISNPAQIACSEVAATGTASQYVLTVFSNNTSPSSNAPFLLQTNGVAAAPAPAPRPLTSGLQSLAPHAGEADARAHDAAHQRLLERNAQELRRLLPILGKDKDVRRDGRGTVEPPLTRTFRIPNINVAQFCANYYVASATRVYYDGKLAIYEDDATPAAFKAASNPTMASNYQRIGDQYNDDMEPIVRGTFGDPLRRDAQTDANGVLLAFSTPRINGSFAGVAGFVTACDQLPNDDASNPGVGGPYAPAGATNGSSNHGEVFYFYQPVVAGPGYSGNTAENWYRTVRSTFVHEVKHVASMSARVANGALLEASWLEEGTARHVEELWMRNAVDMQAWKSDIGYGSFANPINMYCDARPGFAECDANPRRPANIMQRHFSSMYTHMFGTNARLLSPFGATASDNASYWYAISWSLVRYAVDHHGVSEAAFFQALTESDTNGITNLLARANVTLDQLLGGWLLSIAADNHPEATVQGADVQVPTWNLRGIYSGMNTDFPGTYPLPYPLVPTAVGLQGGYAVTVTTLRGGGALWYRIGGGVQTDPLSLSVLGTGGTPTPAAIRMAITRLQ